MAARGDGTQADAKRGPNYDTKIAKYTTIKVLGRADDMWLRTFTSRKKYRVAVVRLLVVAVALSAFALQPGSLHAQGEAGGPQGDVGPMAIPQSVSTRSRVAEKVCLSLGL